MPLPRKLPTSATRRAAEPTAQGGRRGLTAALLLFLGSLTFVTLHHEPWRDEADTWLMARDRSLVDTWGDMGYAGTPMLWYVVLKPFAKLGLPVLVQNLLALTSVAGGVGLLLFRSPFPPWIRVLLCFSFYPAYELSVVARSYSLTVLLLFLAADRFARRLEQPVTYAAILALLANTNLHGTICASALVATDALLLLRSSPHRTSRLRVVAITALGVLLAVLQLLPPPDGQFQSFYAFRSWPVTVALTDAVAPASVLPPGPWIGLIWAVGLLALLLVAVALIRVRAAAIFLVAATSSLLALYSFVYYGGRRHAGLLLLVWVTAAWIAGLGRDLPTGRLGIALAGITRTAVTVALAVSCGFTLHHWALDVTRPFSGARDAADYLIENRLVDHRLAAFPDWLGEAVLVHLPRETLWYAGRQAEGSHMLWDRAQLEQILNLGPNEALHRIETEMGDDPTRLLLFNLAMSDPAAWGYRLVFAGRPPFEHPEERCFVYAPLEGLPTPLPDSGTAGGVRDPRLPRPPLRTLSTRGSATAAPPLPAGPPQGVKTPSRFFPRMEKPCPKLDLRPHAKRQRPPGPFRGGDSGDPHLSRRRSRSEPIGRRSTPTVQPRCPGSLSFGAGELAPSGPSVPPG